MIPTHVAHYISASGIVLKNFLKKKYHKFSYNSLYFSSFKRKYLKFYKNGYNPFCDETLHVQLLFPSCVQEKGMLRWEAERGRQRSSRIVSVSVHHHKGQRQHRREWLNILQAVQVTDTHLTVVKDLLTSVWTRRHYR